MSDNPFETTPNAFSSIPEPQAEVEHESATPPPAPRKFRVGNDRDRNEMYQLMKLKAMLDNQAELTFRQDAPIQENDIVTYDESGKVSGTKHSIMCGTKATNKNQAAMIKALREEVYRTHGIKK